MSVEADQVMSHAGVDPMWLASIAGWLPSRRWFAGKQSLLRGIEAEAAVPITLGGTRESDVVTLLALRASFVDGPDQRYTVPVAVVTIERSGLTPDDVRVIARLDHDRLLVDAMALPDSAAIVVGAAFVTDRHEGRGGAVTGKPGRARGVAHPARIRPLSVEQSNSSVLVGTEHIAKLIRRLEPGPNPDAELSAHLARHRFPHVPELAATLELHLEPHGGATGGRVDVLVVHDAVDNHGDLWSVLGEQLQRELFDGSAFDDRHLPLARLIGRRTAELHAALAAPAPDGSPDAADAADAAAAERMRPVAFTQAWQDELLAALRASLLATRSALAQIDPDIATRLEVDRHRIAELVDGDPDALLAPFDRLHAHVVDARRIRVHGDLHLGQILSTGPGSTAAGDTCDGDAVAGDIVFIDFEGEPGQPIARRVVQRSPLSDVAGLLRSVDYLGRHALRLASLTREVGHDQRTELDAARAGWTERLNRTIVDEYLTAIEAAHLVPADRSDAELLLDLYLLDKGLYEIRYELANRPEWVGAPLAAVTEMIRR